LLNYPLNLICIISIDLHIAHQPPETAHYPVPKIGIQELRRAGAGDDLDALLAADRYRILRDAGDAFHQPGLGAHHAVHPDVLHTQIDALPDNFFGHFGTREDENGIRFFGGGGQIRVTGIAFELIGFWVDGVVGITGILEFLVIQIATRFARFRGADNGDLLLGEEVLGHVVNFCHHNSPV